MTSADLWPLLGIPLLIFLARTADVALGTVRIILISRGQRAIAPLVGAVEVSIWLAALSQVLAHLGRPQNFIAYAGGFAFGTWAGMLLEERLALGLVAVRAITRDDATDLIAVLRNAQFGVTTVAATGVHDHVQLVYSVVPRKEVERLVGLIKKHQPRAFISINDVRSAKEGYFPPPSYSYRSLLTLLRKK